MTGLGLNIWRINFEKTREHFATRPRDTKYTIQIVMFREIKDYLDIKERCQFLCFTILPNTVLIKYFVITAFCLKILRTVIRKRMKYVFVLRAEKTSKDLNKKLLFQATMTLRFCRDL